MNKFETYQYLRNHNILFEAIEHPAVFNMEEAAAIDLPYPECEAKNLFVRDDKRRGYYLITVKGDKRVNLKKLSPTAWLACAFVRFGRRTACRHAVNAGRGYAAGHIE